MDPIWGPSLCARDKAWFQKTAPILFQFRAAMPDFQWSHLCAVQATAAWQWFNWAMDRIPAGKKPGSEPIAASSRKGFDAHRVTRGQSQGALSLLALICDDPKFQPKLPQVIMGNHHILAEKVRVQLAIQSLLMPSVEVLGRSRAALDCCIRGCPWSETRRTQSHAHTIPP